MTESREGDTKRLVEFLRERDVRCPTCGYNLRNLTEADCPECGQSLRLGVEGDHARFGWFLATVTPFLFSGIAAVLLLILLLAVVITGGGPVPPVAFALNLFGVAGGVVAMVLIFRRHRFIGLQPNIQRKWALLVWAIHAVPFLGLVVLTVVTA